MPFFLSSLALSGKLTVAEGVRPTTLFARCLVDIYLLTSDGVNDRREYGRLTFLYLRVEDQEPQKPLTYRLARAASLRNRHHES